MNDVQVDDSGVYQIRIFNEFGNEAFSEKFEIFVADRDIGDALEQPDLDWIIEGPSPWISENYSTYDPEDAVELIPWLDGSTYNYEYPTGNNRLITTIPGPVYIRFWWKDGFFESNDREIWLAYQGAGWQQGAALLTAETNVLKWSSQFLDRVQIDYLNDDPFRFWAFQEFQAEEVILNFPHIRDGDRDFDGFSNFIEWALNKHPDFPNSSQPFKIFEIEGKQYLGFTNTHPAELGKYSIHLETCTDLETWERIDSVVISETFHPSNNTYTVSIRDIQALGTDGGRFIRLVVTDE